MDQWTRGIAELTCGICELWVLQFNPKTPVEMTGPGTSRVALLSGLCGLLTQIGS